MKLANVVLIAVFAATMYACDATESIAWRQTFDEDGRVATTIDPSGRETRYQYETSPNGDVAKLLVIPPEGPKVSYSFDDGQRLIEMTDGEGSVDYGYDEDGNLSSVQREGRPAIKYTYDLANRLASMDVGDFYHMAWNYDYLGRLESMDTPAGTVSYEYQTGRNEVIRTLPNGVKTFWKWKPNGQLESITHGYFENPDSRSYRVLARYTYDHDANGRIKTIREESGRGKIVKEYSYDTMGRLVQAVDSSGQEYGYEYDSVGNRTRATTTGQPDQDYSYDWAGRLTSINGKPVSYDASGNLSEIELEGTTRNYRFYPDNRLAEATVKGQTTKYRYDGHGRLVTRMTDDGKNVFLPDPLSSYWLPLLIDEPKNTRTLVVWDGAIPLATIRNGKTEWLLNDHLGSVRLVTDAKGKVNRHEDYEPFGSVVGGQHSQLMSPGYAGLFEDVGLQLTLARSYAYELGAFLQPDPQIRGLHLDASLYSYCGADPMGLLDRDGAEPIPTDYGAKPLMVTDGNGNGVIPVPLRELPETGLRKSAIKEIHRNAQTEALRILLNEKADFSVADLEEHTWKVVEHWDSKARDDYYDRYPNAMRLKSGEWQTAEHYALMRAMLVSEKDITTRERKYISPKGVETLNRGWELAHWLGENSMGRIKSDTVLIWRGYRQVEGGKWYNKIGATIDIAITGSYNSGPNTRVQAVGWEPLHPDRREFMEMAIRDATTVKNGFHSLDVSVDFSADRQPKAIDYFTSATTRKEFHQHRLNARDLTERIMQGVKISRDVQQLHPYDVKSDPGRIASLRVRNGFASQSSIEQMEAYHRLSVAIPKPSNVGGVYLGGALDSIKGLGTLRGVRLDANGNLVLVGGDSGEVKLPSLRLDDVVAIFRSVYIHGEGPSVTIDPNPKDPEKLPMIIRHGKATEDTYVGWVLYEADRLMKGYTQGVDNKTKQDVESTVTGYDKVLDTIYFGGADPREGQKDGVWERFWIVPAEANRFEGERRELTLFDVPLKVNTQKMKWEKGKLVDDKQGESSPGATAFTEWFTDKYDDIADERYLVPPPESGITDPVPVYLELRRIALITAIAEKLHDDGVPMPFWMREYEVRKVPFEKTTPGLEVTRTKHETDVIRTARIFGGVALTPENKVVKSYATDADVAKAPKEIRAEVEQEVQLAGRLEQVLADTVATESFPVLSSKKVEIGGDTYSVAAVPGAETKALGPARLDEVDVAVPVPGGRRIELVRSFNSFFHPKGPWGDGWALNLPHLEKVVVPISREGGKVITTTGYELLTPLNSYYARFLSGKPVSGFVNPDNPIVDSKSPFYGMYLGKPSFFDNRETDMVRLKDGRQWHFSKHGELVAMEDGPMATVYERDRNKRLTKISAILGGSRAAEIRLAYTSDGRLEKATGKDLLGEDKAPMEMTYYYGTDGRLSGLEESVSSTRSNEAAGRLTYEYSGPWVSKIKWRDAEAKDSEPIALKSFEYNEHGQLLSESRGNDRHDYAITATKDGPEVQVAKSATDGIGIRARYDNQMRPTEMIAADGTTTTWTYGADGAIDATTMTPDGWKMSVTDSADGRERQVKSDGSPEIRVNYDEGARLVKLTEGNQELLSQQWRPDGQLVAVTTPSQAAHLRYGDNAVLKSIMLHPPTTATTLSEWRETAVDLMGQPTAIKDSTGLDLQIRYEKSGSLKSFVQSTPEGKWGYELEHDDEGRIEKVESSWGTMDFSYSDEGNLEEVESERDGADASIELDDGRISKIVGYDGGTTRYKYYDDGKLSGLPKEVTLPNSLELDNVYDNEGRLEAVTVGSVRRVKLEYDSKGRITGYVWESN